MDHYFNWTYQRKKRIYRVCPKDCSGKIRRVKNKMQVTETLNEGLKRAYSIVVTASELNETVDEKLREAQPEVELKGFRKGKVPLPL